MKRLAILKKFYTTCIWCVAVIALFAIISVLVCNQLVVSNAKGKVFSDIDSIRPTEVGLLLGTTPQARIGRITNYFFVYRIDAAEQLYKAGKIKKILISGDENSLDGVNEPECMRDSLVARGVPESAIILDGKGYRTICSVINANKVYGLKSFIVISQKFHNERAIYQAEHLGLSIEDIQGYNAEDPKSRRAYLTSIREYFARVKMFWDVLTFKQPRESDMPHHKIRMDDESICETDSFTVVYRQLVHGYKVKAIIKIEESDVYVMNADLIFTKGGKSFTLHSTCFGDTIFCKGRLDIDKETIQLYNKFRHQTIETDYSENNKNDEFMPGFTPFFFRDVDFDGVKELVIVHYSMAVRFHSGYSVYRIVKGSPILIDYPPYWSGDYDDFGMTDYPEFDRNTRTISCPYPEGPGGLPYAGRIIYGISKMRKDTVQIHDSKYYFNHMEVVKRIKYDDKND